MALEKGLKSELRASSFGARKDITAMLPFYRLYSNLLKGGFYEISFRLFADSSRIACELLFRGVDYYSELPDVVRRTET